jgi:hypothetical protein
MNKSTKGMMIAASVATLLAGSLVMADSSAKVETDVHCAGVNACKAHGECAGDGHGCGGKNSCKGKGWVTLSAKECKAKGGSVAGEKKSAPASSAAASAPMK